MVSRLRSQALLRSITRSITNWECAAYVQPLSHINSPTSTSTHSYSTHTPYNTHSTLWKRYFSEGLRTDISEISELEYHQIADKTLDDMAEKLETFLESLDLDESDVEHSQGVLTVKLGALGTYVINKQTPNRQIWMSSPVSGPFRYDYGKGRWVYHRDGHAMHERIENELEQLTGERINLNPCASCEKLNACEQGNYCLQSTS